MVCGENSVGLLEGFLRANVVPRAGHAPRVNRHPRVEPLDQPTGLVGVVSVGEVLVDERQHRPGIVIKRNTDQRRLWRSRFLLKTGDATVGIRLDDAVLGGLLQAADVVHAEHGGVLLRAQPAVIAKFVAEQIVAGNHDNVVVDALAFQDQMQVPNRAEFVVVPGGMVVHDPHRRGKTGRVAPAGPRLKMASEFFVGHDERLVDGVDRPEAGQNMIDHWLAGDRQQRLGLVER